MRTDFYVYAYLRTDGTPYYIGKGCGKRAFSKHKRMRAPRRSQIKLTAENLSEAEAFALEISEITKYGRKDLGTGILRNLSNGGEGTSGISPEHSTKLADSNRRRVCSDETRAKMSAAHKGRTLSAEHCTKLSQVRKGRFVSDETKAKISTGHKGKSLSAEHRAKISQARKGKSLSAEHRAKLSAAGLKASKGRVFSDEHRRKITEALTGKALSAEHKAKAKLSSAWARRRAAKT